MKFEFSQKDFEYDGVVFQRKEFSDFTLVELHFSPNLEFSRHAHERANFCVILQGGSTEFSAATRREYKPLTVGFLPSFQSHSVKISSAGMSAFSIELAPRWLERLREFSLKAEGAVFGSGGVLLQLLLKIYREYDAPDAATPLVVEAITLEMLAEVSRHQTGSSELLPPRWLKRVRELIQRNFSQPFSLTLLAQEVGIHPSHLAKTFRQHYHCTLGEYVRRHRLEYAKQELAQSAKPVSEIALNAGFYDQSHFANSFKLHYGLTPSEFRTLKRP